MLLMKSSFCPWLSLQRRVHGLKGIRCFKWTLCEMWIDFQNISVCLYYLSLNLILSSKGILQQNSFSRNFHFFICNFFRKSNLLPLVGMTACHFYLPCPLCPPSHMLPGATDVTRLCLYRLPGLFFGLVSAADRTRCCHGCRSGYILAAPGWPACAHAVFIAHQKLSGPSPSVLSHWAPCELAFLLSSCPGHFLQAFVRPKCLGIGKQ